MKVVETSDPGVLNSIRNESTILPKLQSSLINKFEAYYEDLERNKAYLVLEHAGEKTLTEFMEDIRGASGPQSRLSDDEVRQIMTKLL